MSLLEDFFFHFLPPCPLLALQEQLLPALLAATVCLLYRLIPELDFVLYLQKTNGVPQSKC